MPPPAEPLDSTSSFASSQLSSSSFLRSVQESFLPPAAAGTCVLSLSSVGGGGPLGSQPVWQLFGSGAVSLFNPPSGIDELRPSATATTRRRRRERNRERRRRPPSAPSASVSVRPSVGEATSPPSDFHCRVIQCAYKPNQHLTVRPRPRPSPRPSGCVHACVQRAASGGGDVGTELLHDN